MTTSPIDLLWVSIGFPPKNDPDALQTVKLLKYLQPRADLAISAVTSANPTLWMSTDAALERYAAGCRQVIEVPILEPRLVSIALLKLASPFVMLPDMRMTFHWQWRSVVRQLRRLPRVLVSRSFPVSATILASRLQRHFNVPWILHLSDPWVDNAIMRFRGPSALYHRRAQARCFAAASVITLASPAMVDFYRARYPQWAHKFELLPNLFDEADLLDAAAPRSPSGALKVVYTGSLTGDRKIGWFLDGLERLRRHRADVVARIEVAIAGELDSANRDSIRRAGFENVSCLGKLPFADAQQLQRDADVLLVIDNPLPPDASLFLPSKLLDYLVTRNPILAITSAGSMTRRLVHGAAGLSVEHGDAEGIALFLADKLAASAAGQSVHGTGPGPDPIYGARYNADRLHELIKKLASR